MGFEDLRHQTKSWDGLLRRSFCIQRYKLILLTLRIKRQNDISINLNNFRFHILFGGHCPTDKHLLVVNWISEMISYGEPA